MLDHTWTCACCGKQQRGLPLEWSAKAPDNYFGVPEAERDARTKLSHDFCRIDDQVYLRGLIELPIIGAGDCLRWGIWVSLSEASFRTVLDVWNQPGEEQVGPFFGWLSNKLRLYPRTINLKTRAHLRATTAPRIELEPTGHPLAVEQRDGITLDRAVEIAQALLPKH